MRHKLKQGLLTAALVTVMLVPALARPTRAQPIIFYWWRDAIGRCPVLCDNATYACPCDTRYPWGNDL